MKRFAELYQQLDRTNKTNEKVFLLKSYFTTAPDEDKIWALALFTGRRPKLKFKSGMIQAWAMELAGIPSWLFSECYSSVGDQAETISLILPSRPSSADRSLDEWFRAMGKIRDAGDEEKRKFILAAWQELTPYEIFVFNKLLMGSFRIGVSQTLIVRAVAEASSQEPSVIAHRVMGEWDPYSTSYHNLIHRVDNRDQVSRPYPFYLAYAIEGDLDGLGPPHEWFAEWKWDGIRSQIIFRNGELFIWSRGEELVTSKFPELHEWARLLPPGTVLDGEIVCYSNGQPMPFNILQTRIGRKNLTRKILTEAPAAFIGYDVLESGGADIRTETQEKRRKLLEDIHSQSPGAASGSTSFKLSRLIPFHQWDDLNKLHPSSRGHYAEGFMLKRKSGPYQVGRKKGNWWKWKIDPLTIDAVLIYAQKGHGRRAELYTDYTFGVWDDGKLIPFAKAYSGLTDEEIRQVDYFVKRNTLEKFGPVRTVKPELVFEIGFEGINKSGRHKSGLAVRFPRMLRWRKDKRAGRG